MSNHYHIVLRVDAERARDWSAGEMLRRWTQLFTGPLLVAESLEDSAHTSIAARRGMATARKMVHKTKVD